MRASGSESHLVSDVIELYELSVRQVVAVATFLNQHIGGSVGIRHQRSLFCASYSVASQEVVRVLTMVIASEVILNQRHLVLCGRCQCNANEADEKGEFEHFFWLD